MSLADPLPRNTMFVPREICRDFSRSSRLEWLDTNHTGAFAMGTVAGVNTRRYHALLLASLHPPADRYSILPRVEETALVDNQPFALSTVQYPGAVKPRGFELLNDFAAQPFPTWTYECGNVSIQKSVCLLDHKQAVLVRYQATGACWLTVQLFLSCRDYHSLTHKNETLNAQAQKVDAGFLSFQPLAHLPRLHFLHNAVRFQPAIKWYLRHEYLRDLERGFDFQEDLCSPGSLAFYLDPHQPAYFVASLQPDSLPRPLLPVHVDAILKHERHRREYPTLLARSLDQFQVRRSDGQPALLAGYPWFTDWSRDTLISLPALNAAGFPATTTKSILQSLIGKRKEGVLPNHFSDRDLVPEYNTVDASLWFFIAAHSYLSTTDDQAFLAGVLYPAALDIIDAYLRGTYYNIVVDATDNLLSAGHPGVQLTWMDSKIGDYVVTPRIGKPVEINALWYNALRITAEWAQALGNLPEAESLTQKAQAVHLSFNLRFWNETRGCLYDVLTPDGPDASLRPNQLFALSLPYPLVSRDRALPVFEIVRDCLLTPVGLRTLEPGDAQYQPRFQGNMQARDRAYHQGTVWPWLIGPFICAWLYSHNESAEAVQACRELVTSMLLEFERGCLGSVAEVYDAEAPQLPGGCPAQLWSVAQLLLAAKRLDCLPAA